MSAVSLEDAKAFLDVIHSGDDGKLQLLLSGAIDEAERFVGRKLSEIPNSGERGPPASAVVGVMLLLQATYQAAPDDAAKLRLAAEIKLKPHRAQWEDV
ncbi:phage gp6-like head-tail connector protein [Paenalcaligenes niemegkensis]|uniref:head-tail connector protein n=1 Tax=Paenalcaligenes niemegkensis TaxID=2895469 RepID=UPI001EE7FE1F|nr:head-tail connector protein [Paenalcaligenes niemegkensis]MCQ9615935.1 phage gp6-like head-tail connector protein [Paenalcaligenes niemegkensis]